MSKKHKRLRALKKKNAKPQSVEDLFTKLATVQYTPDTAEIAQGTVMKAFCKRLANRSKLVGKTSFAFDENGVCEVKPNGRGSFATDFAILVKMNGITEIIEEEATPPKAKAKKAKKADKAKEDETKDESKEDETKDESKEDETKDESEKAEEAETKDESEETEEAETKDESEKAGKDAKADTKPKGKSEDVDESWNESEPAVVGPGATPEK